MCRELGIEDYQQWLEDCPDRVFNAWADAYDVEPFGDEQLLMARLCALMYMQVQSRFKDDTFKVMDSLTACFMPTGWVGRDKPKFEIDLDSIKRSQEALAKWKG